MDKEDITGPIPLNAPLIMHVIIRAPLRTQPSDPHRLFWVGVLNIAVWGWRVQCRRVNYCRVNVLVHNVLAREYFRITLITDFPWSDVNAKCYDSNLGLISWFTGYVLIRLALDAYLGFFQCLIFLVVQFKRSSIDLVSHGDPSFVSKNIKKKSFHLLTST